LSRHSEFNPSQDEPVHLYQIWLLPRQNGLDPSYEQKRFADEEKHNRLRVVASPDGREGSLFIHTDASVYLATLDEGRSVDHGLAAGRHAWLQVLRGSVRVNGQSLETSDGAAISDKSQLVIEAAQPAEIMLFDLA
jgi:quercetin 2,3-dioxygenase